MINNETHLLYSVLCYEEGHCRRTQHILKVYALAKLIGEQEKISVEDQQILQAAAILHDVAIKYCKEHYNGDASQNNQKQVVSILVTRFLESANYLCKTVNFYQMMNALWIILIKTNHLLH